MPNTHKILIYTALYPEAKPLIQHFNLVQNSTHKSLRIFENNKYILVVGGIGQENTRQILPFMFEHFNISKAINIGIAGCRDRKVKLGTLFCTNHTLEGISRASITTVDKPLEDKFQLQTLLADMESKSFLQTVHRYLNEEDVFVFKTVSDYLSKAIPDKSLVYNSIKKSIPKWENVI